jgi:hypothetical protein
LANLNKVLEESLFLFGFYLGGFPQTHPSTTAIFVDELDALTGQYVLYQRERSWISSIPTYLNIRNRISMKTGRRG